ncbi:MAG TPA: hypothetical protein VK395_21890 [Gemmataceae bacterium]|nr:hypothetical protein [Gemmataceae bacterium]
MTQFRFALGLACIYIAAPWAAPAPIGRATEGTRAVPLEALAEDKADKKREELWKALMKALPKEYKEIDAYAENSSLTAVLLYGRHAVRKFSLESRKVEQIPVMKALGRINRIAFEQHGQPNNP